MTITQTPGPREDHVQMIREACRQIQRAEHPPALAELASAAGLSPFYFQRVFLQWVGITPRAYAVAWQRERLVRALSRGTPVLQAIYAAGYSSTSRVYERLEQLLGMTPAEMRKGARGLQIAFAMSPCEAGWLMVATTARGLCAVELGGDPEELAELLSARFPDAHLSDGPAAMVLVVALVAHRASDLPPVRGLPEEIRLVAVRQRLRLVLHRLQLATIRTYTDVRVRLPLLQAAALDRVGLPGAEGRVASA